MEEKIKLTYHIGMRAALWATLGIVTPFNSAWGGACEELGVDCSHGNYGRPSGGDYSPGRAAGQRARRWIDCNLFGSGCPDQTENRRDAGHALNEQGIQAYNKRDWATAAAYSNKRYKIVPTIRCFARILPMPKPIWRTSRQRKGRKERRWSGSARTKLRRTTCSNPSRTLRKH